MSVSGVDEFETSYEGKKEAERRGSDFALSYKYSFLLADESGSSKLALQAVSRVKSANERPLSALSEEGRKVKKKKRVGKEG